MSFDLMREVLDLLPFPDNGPAPVDPTPVSHDLGEGHRISFHLVRDVLQHLAECSGHHVVDVPLVRLLAQHKPKAPPSGLTHRVTKLLEHLKRVRAEVPGNNQPSSVVTAGLGHSSSGRSRTPEHNPPASTFLKP